MGEECHRYDVPIFFNAAVSFGCRHLIIYNVWKSAILVCLEMKIMLINICDAHEMRFGQKKNCIFEAKMCAFRGFFEAEKGSKCVKLALKC